MGLSGSSVILWDQVSSVVNIVCVVTESLHLAKSPGVHSATVGHHFSNPTNHFWRCLFDSGESFHEFVFADNSFRCLGLVANYIPPSEDHTLPLFSLGLVSCMFHVLVR